jgi:hypothetical protein
MLGSLPVDEKVIPSGLQLTMLWNAEGKERQMRNGML